MEYDTAILKGYSIKKMFLLSESNISDDNLHKYILNNLIFFNITTYSKSNQFIDLIVQNLRKEYVIYIETKKPMHSNTIEHIINQDTLKYNNITTTRNDIYGISVPKNLIISDKYILTYNIIKYIYNKKNIIYNIITGYNNFISDNARNFHGQLRDLIKNLFINLFNIKQLYDIINIKNKSDKHIYMDLFTRYHTDLLNSNKRVFSIIRIRNDNIHELGLLNNPRYDIPFYNPINYNEYNYRNGNDINYINITYYNSDYKYNDIPDNIYHSTYSSEKNKFLNKIINDYININYTDIVIDNYDNISSASIHESIKTLDYKQMFTKYNIKKKYDLEEEYVFGKFDNVFTANHFNNYIENNIRTTYDKILFDNKKKNLFIIGFGQSGSGKTSSLIYLNRNDLGLSEEEKKGVIIHYLYHLADDKEINTITLSIYNLYVNQKNDNIKLGIESNNSKEYYLFTPLINEVRNDNGIETLIHELTFTYNNKKFSCIISGEQKYLENYINDTITTDLRQTGPTPNNPESSRSHVFIDIKFKYEGNDKHIIVCDLAGVENEFTCNYNSNLQEIKNFMAKYKQNRQYTDIKT